MSKPAKNSTKKAGKHGPGPDNPGVPKPPSSRPQHNDAGLTDVATLRERARKSIDDGAITESYTADRKVVIKLLNEALATEWVCVLRYYRHYFMASGMLADSVKAEFLEHAQQELAHANKISERIVQLGGEPDLNPDTLTMRSHAEYKPGHDLRDMVKENLIAERIEIGRAHV